MRDAVKGSVFQTLMQVREINELTETFEKEGIVNQPLKGARLKFMYPSPEMREMSDIDILFSKECMDKAGKILTDAGYRLVRSVKHHDIYRKGKALTLEAHKTLYDKTVDSNQYQYYRNFDRAKLVEGKKYTYDFDVNDFYV